MARIGKLTGASGATGDQNPAWPATAPGSISDRPRIARYWVIAPPKAVEGRGWISARPSRSCQCFPARQLRR